LEERLPSLRFRHTFGVESLQDYHFFALMGKKNEAARLHFTEPSGSTSHLHAAFSRSSLKYRSRLACEAAPFGRL